LALKIAVKQFFTGLIEGINENLGLLLIFENLLTKVENQKENMLFLYYTNQNYKNGKST